MKIGIVLSTYNSDSWTAECLRTLYKYTPADLFDLYIFNNGSTDNTSKIISKYDCFSFYSVVNQGGIPGYIHAIKFMLDRKCYSHICIIQNDMLFTPNWLTDSMSLFKIYDSKSVIGISNIIGRDCLFMSDEQREAVSVAAKEKHYSFANTFPLFIPVSVFDDVGFPDMIYNHGECDDIDFNMRLASKGYDHIVSNNINVFHGIGVARLSIDNNAGPRSSSVNYFVSKHGKEAFDRFNYARKVDFFCDGIPYTRYGA